MPPVIGLFLIIAGLVAIATYYSRYLIKKALCEVVTMFREREATNDERAVTRQELGLIGPTLLSRMMSMRDYRYDALEFLIRANIIKKTPDGKLSLMEEELKASQLKNYANIKAVN